MSARLPRAGSARRLQLAVAIAVALAAPIATAQEVLLLDVSVNGRALPGIVTAEFTDEGQVLVPAEAWKAARLRLPAEQRRLSDGTAAYALDAAAGMQWTLDRNWLRLDVRAPSEAFERNTVSLRGDDRPAAAPPARGAYIDYDAFAGWDDGAGADAGVVAEFVAFGRRGSFVHGQAWRRDGAGDHAVRLETFFQRDLPARMETVVLGDAITSAGGWSRPARYAGVRYAREFSTAPGFVTWPVPSLSGSAALPSTVDLLVNERRQGQQQVPAGPFDLSDIPLGNGGGDLQLVVRDVLGRQTVVQQSYYVATDLLAVGLSDFSHEAGWLRRGFGGEDDRYDEAFAASSYRRGVTDWLTLGGRAEWQRDRQATGVHAMARLGSFGVAGASLAASRVGEVHGARGEFTLQRVTRTGGLSLRWMQADRDFREFGGAGLDDRRPRRELQASFGHRITDRVAVGLQALRRDSWDGERFRLWGANLSVSFTRGAQLSLDVSRRPDDGDWAGLLRFTLPLGTRRSLQATTARRADGEALASAELRQGLPAGPGWGWRLAASTDDAQRVQGDLVRRGNHGEWTAASRLGPDRAALRLGARGAIGRVAGMGFASRRVDRGAFAVVDVGGVPGVPVRLSHQEVATTNAQGRALVPGLLPYQVNRLSIDATRLPLDAQVGADDARLVPYARTGTVLAFPVVLQRQDWLVLQTADGLPVPEGARVRVGPGLAEFIVARRGEAYVSGLGTRANLEVRWKDGACRVSVDGRRLATPGARNAPMTCREVSP
jgi:outer membrane usher protein